MSHIYIDEESINLEKEIRQIIGESVFNRSKIYKEALNNKLKDLGVENLDIDLLLKKFDVAKEERLVAQRKEKQLANLLKLVEEKKTNKINDIKNKVKIEKKLKAEKLKIAIDVIKTNYPEIRSNKKREKFAEEFVISNSKDMNLFMRTRGYKK